MRKKEKITREETEGRAEKKEGRIARYGDGRGMSKPG